MYDLVVIGGGSAGRSVAAAAARVGARVALVVKNAPAEKDSASVCWPSMGLFQAARLARELSGGVRFGVTMGTPQSDFGAVMAHVRAVALALESRGSALVLKGKGVEIHNGSAAFSAYDTVKVDGELLPSHRFVIATGSRSCA